MKRYAIAAAFIALIFLLPGCNKALDGQDLIRDIWPKISGYWYLPEDELRVFEYFGYSDDGKEIKYSGWYYSEHTEYAYAVDIAKSARNVHNITFWVPENKEEGMFEPHDEYFYDIKFDLSGINSGKIKILRDDGEDLDLEYFAATLEEALAKYDKLVDG